MKDKKINKKSKVGEVIAISGEKTAKVRVESTRVSRLYAKRYKVHKSFLVDTSEVKVEIGDKVEIVSVVPISKKKKHKISKKVK